MSFLPPTLPGHIPFHCLSPPRPPALNLNKALNHSSTSLRKNVLPRSFQHSMIWHVNLGFLLWKIGCMIPTFTNSAPISSLLFYCGTGASDKSHFKQKWWSFYLCQQSLMNKIFLLILSSTNTGSNSNSINVQLEN